VDAAIVAKLVSLGLYTEPFTLSQAANLISIVTPNTWNSASGTWQGKNGMPGWVLPGSGWAWDSNERVVAKTDASETGLSYVGASSTFSSIKSAVVVANPYTLSHTMCTVLCDPGDSNTTLGFWNEYYANNQGKPFASTGTRFMLDSQLLNSGQQPNPSINPRDNKWHIMQFTGLDISSWSSLATLPWTQALQSRYEPGAAFQCIALFSVNLTDAEMTANYNALSATLPS
jgi:hypothetical protein